MKVELRKIDRSNFLECVSLEVAPEQRQYIATNADSLKEAEENCHVARAFAIYINDQIAGFAMFAFDEEYEDIHDRYWLWRFMIDKNLQGKGYGGLALREIICYFKEHGADHIRLSTKESNVTAISLYHRFGFRKTGQMNEDEMVFELTFHK